MATLPAERRLEILERVKQRPMVRADELAEHFGVSVETIRRDLIALERDGETRRVYGGAVRAAPSPFEAPFERRRAANAEQKRAMGRLAASLVEADDLLLLDVGTSVLEVAAHLPATFRGRVLTNSLLVVAELASREKIELLASGGRVRAGDLACSGPQTEAFFAGFYGGKAFLGSGAVHPTIGLTDYYPDEIAVRRIILDRAAELYLMADSSKLGQIALAKVCDLNELTAIITDDGVAASTVRAFEDAGVRLMIAAAADSAPVSFRELAG
jgi:DeoR family transcriptional regulator, fructose operon transcriptional repressor